MLVWKSGRSTGLTRGFVDGIKMKVAMNYQAMGVHMLQEVIRIVPRPGGIGGEISIGGDSGSVWVDEDSGKAVGLHFAGEVGNNPEHALAHDIDVIFEALQVHFPTEPPPVIEPPVIEPPVIEPPRPDQPPPTAQGRHQHRIVTRPSDRQSDRHHGRPPVQVGVLFGTILRFF